MDDNLPARGRGVAVKEIERCPPGWRTELTFRAGIIRWRNLRTVRTASGFIAMNRSGIVVVEELDGEGRVHPVPYGSLMLMGDGERVSSASPLGQALFSWDPAREFIRADVDGTVRFEGFIPGKTVRQEGRLPEVWIQEGLYSHLSRSINLPSIAIVDDDGECVITDAGPARYFLPHGSILETVDGARVAAGDVLATCRRSRMRPHPRNPRLWESAAGSVKPHFDGAFLPGDDVAHLRSPAAKSGAQLLNEAFPATRPPPPNDGVDDVEAATKGLINAAIRAEISASDEPPSSGTNPMFDFMQAVNAVYERESQLANGARDLDERTATNSESASDLPSAAPEVPVPPAESDVVVLGDVLRFGAMSPEERARHPAVIAHEAHRAVRQVAIERKTVAQMRLMEGWREESEAEDDEQRSVARRKIEEAQREIRFLSEEEARLDQRAAEDALSRRLLLTRRPAEDDDHDGLEGEVRSGPTPGRAQGGPTHPDAEAEGWASGHESDAQRADRYRRLAEEFGDLLLVHESQATWEPAGGPLAVEPSASGPKDHADDDVRSALAKLDDTRRAIVRCIGREHRSKKYVGKCIKRGATAAKNHLEWLMKEGIVDQLTDRPHQNDPSWFLTPLGLRILPLIPGDDPGDDR